MSGLDTPWDLAWGPDGSIWVTERPGLVSRVDPSTGTVTPVGEVEVLERGESGLMGMAFHPDFANQPYVYLAHSYGDGGDIKNRFIRMRYDGARPRLNRDSHRRHPRSQQPRRVALGRRP